MGLRGPAAMMVLGVLAIAAACGDSDGTDSLSAVAAEGRQISHRAGCSSCHGADGQGGIGPAWAGSLGAQVELADGTIVTVDEAYLSRSISDPAAQVRSGFDVTMPGNDLTDEEIADVVAYIVELNAESSG